MVNQTLESIRESMISLLEEKEYGRIQMKKIAEKVRSEIEKNSGTQFAPEVAEVMG